jgi:YbgC/YbaW family acyl-CoA thioester hydrolase
MVYKTQIRVQWFDLDRADIVYFGNYFRFFTIAEEEFLRSLDISYNVLRDKYNMGLTRVEAECRYIRPIVSEDLIEVHTKPKLENSTFLTLYFQIFRSQDQLLLAKGRVRAACIILKPQFKLTKFPQEVFDKLKPFINNDEES